VTQALFTLDLNRCTGCSACSVACRTENDVPLESDWRKVYTFNAARLPAAGVFHYSLACNHCAEPACMHGCPANAYSKDARTGAVLLDAERCIGCRYCWWVCPYDAPQFNSATGVMEKCTFCSHRLDEGRAPACVVACPVDALGFEPRGEPGPIEHPGLPETGIGPALRVTPKRRHGGPPEMAGVAAASVATDLRRPARASGMRSEWSLLVFSFVATCLVAGFAAREALGGLLHPLGFFLAGALAMTASTLHLGKPGRAWRVVSNLRSSWISREIVCFSAFFAAACAVLFFDLSHEVPARVTALLGFAALFSMDMVYRVRGRASATFPHSAMTSFSAIYLAGLALPLPLLALTAGALKLVLYLVRLRRLGGDPWLAAARVVTGFVAPALVWFAHPEPFLPLLLAGPLVGELIDRAQFYANLDFPSPTHQIHTDLRTLVAQPGTFP